MYQLSAIGIPVVILLPWYINRKKEGTRANDSREIELNSESDIPYIKDKSIIVLPFENISSDQLMEHVKHEWESVEV